MVRVAEGSEDAAAVAATVVPSEDRLEASAGRNTKEERMVVRVVVVLVVVDTGRVLEHRGTRFADVCFHFAK